MNTLSIKRSVQSAEVLYLVLNHQSTALRTSLETIEERQNGKHENYLLNDYKENMAIDLIQPPVSIILSTVQLAPRMCSKLL